MSAAVKQTIRQRADGSQAIMLGKVILSEKKARRRSEHPDWKFSLEVLRLREIEKVIRSRHGRGVPDPYDTDDIDTCLAYVLAVAFTPRVQDVETWCEMWAPWISQAEIDLMKQKAARRKHMLPADSVAKLMNVTLAERTRLKLKTIGACDVCEEQRKKIALELKREQDRARQEHKRMLEGRVSRAEYEASSVSQAKPWEAEGVSRRTWYRRHGTGLSRVEDKTIGDTPVPNSKTGPSCPRHEQKIQVRTARLSVGLGDHPPAVVQEAAPHGSIDRIEARHDR